MTQTQKAIEKLSTRGFFVGDIEKGAKVFPQRYRGAFLRKFSDAFETNYRYDFQKDEAIEKFFDYWNLKFRAVVEKLAQEV